MLCSVVQKFRWLGLRFGNQAPLPKTVPLVCRRAPRRPRWPFYGKWNGVKTRMGKSLVRFVTPPGSLTSSNTSPICRTI